MGNKPISDVYLQETAARQVIDLAPEGRTSQVRVHRARPVRVFELEASRGFIPTGCLLLPERPAGRSTFAPLTAALDRARAKPTERFLVAGHAPDAALATRRAEVVRALLVGDRDAFVALALAHGIVKEWQELLGWTARARGIDCDPKGADGAVGPNTRGALARFREALGIGPGDPDGPGEADWRAWAGLLDEELAARLKVEPGALAARRALLQLVPKGAIGCAALWPARSATILEHTTMADERVDVLAFAPNDVPKLACHAGPELDQRACDLYRKGKYRCGECRPAEPVRGFVCFEVEGLRFDFDRSLVKPDAFPTLAEAKSILDDDAKLQATLYGHTDTVGDEDYNKLLSERRARSVLAVLTHDLEAWEEIWTKERWDDKLAREVAAAVSPAAAAEAAPRAALQAFQRERGLGESGAADAPTRRALGEAYFRAAVAEPVPAERFIEHLGGRRFMGCGEMNPVGDGMDERSRRVVLMIFDPEKAPRDLPCTVGDLKPCKANVRPQPPRSDMRADGANNRCAVFRRLASTCACGQRPTPRIITFRYGVEVSADHPWSEAATLTLTDEQGAERGKRTLAEGELHGRLRVLDFKVERDVRCRGDLREGPLSVPMFGLSPLHDIASDDGPTDHLAPPDREPAPAFDPEPTDDHGILRIRLHDRRGAVMRSAHFRLTVAGKEHVGSADPDGFAAAPLPPQAPASCTIEWGEPDEEGRFPFSAEVMLDHAGPDALSSMLHNLGYPRRLALDTRVRAFQKAHQLTEKGLTAKGEVPPLTKAKIVSLHESQARS